MSDETKRDESGRFVKRKSTTEKIHDLHTPDDEGVHPVAKILFGWTEAKQTGNIIFIGLAVLSLILFGIDATMNRHAYFSFLNWTGFYGLWGFGSFAFVVLMGHPLAKLLRRSPEYYGDESQPPADIDPDLKRGGDA